MRHPVTNTGPHYPLPYPGGTGLGKPLKPIVHPLRNDIPIVLGAEGPKNVALAAEIADGWFPIFFSPDHMGEFTTPSTRASPGPGPGAAPPTSRSSPSALWSSTTTWSSAADLYRPMLALYIGGMGAKEMNFHFDVFVRMGFEAEAHKIQELYLDGHKDEAAAAVPTSMVEKIALIGPRQKIRDELAAWQESIATTLLVAGSAETLRMMAEFLL